MTRSDEMRVRILDAALELLTRDGRDALTTRALTSELKIQAPTIYRIFGDKQGLLDEVTLHGFSAHLSSWTGWVEGTEPVESLRQGWDMHVTWGLENPHVYSVAYGDPRIGTSSPAAREIDAIVRTQLEVAARAGALTLPVGAAAEIIRAAGVGVVFTLLASPPEDRDMKLSHRTREAIFGVIFDDLASGERRSGAAMQLKHQLEEGDAGLSPGEAALLGEWLDRLADARA